MVREHACVRVMERGKAACGKLTVIESRCYPATVEARKKVKKKFQSRLVRTLARQSVISGTTATLTHDPGTATRGTAARFFKGTSCGEYNM